ncbi:MAG TPA: DeoR/GlpR family DNA-binding transcription regulator [Bryobacteraceae bacterium]|nr:DeoR/GlpR family DNA-binding transcription regulator [Bryobacteraceae bacterium]
MAGKRSHLLADERRREIVKILKSDGRVSVEDLVRRFSVSAVTLRADLGQLARKGILVRSYGGAMLPQEPHQEYPLNVKRTIYHAEKTRIGRAAVKLIRPHQTIVLDSGTTSAEVARAIKASGLDALTVITHALNIASEFVDASHISVIMIGGIMRHVSGSFVGPQAERLITELHADHFFLGVDGLDAEVGLSTPDLLEAQLNTMMMRISNEVTVVADASKLGRRSLSVIGPIDSVRRVITDDRAGPEMLEAMRRRGVEVVVV